MSQERKLLEPTRENIKLFSRHKTEQILEKLKLSGDDEHKKFFDDIFITFERDDPALECIFEKHSKPEYEDTLFKMVLLDKLYNTQIVNPVDFAKAIKEIKIPSDEVPNPSIVEAIADWRNGKEIEGRREYSFAAKYCHFHNPKYPIYDEIIAGLLRDYRYTYHPKTDCKKKFFQMSFYVESRNKDKSLKTYKTFFDVFTAFQKYINEDAPTNEQCTVKEIDVFLWTYGKYLNKYGEK